ncbi:MAG TPA: anaerobic glycerol-3-phosphate dehydrogenase subunit GlpB [Solirubrobacteraceae bacterium]|nr:anaerobic glycerol-3-phosphate dehydrogenase subunit GlpB [Solirubrobacteraceae bacterium]
MIVVVGAGLAGLVAAVRLAEGGERVLVLAKGVGATHLSPCTIDVLGYAPDRVANPLAAVDSLAADHPYALVGRDGIVAAAAWWSESMPYVGSVEENLLLPTAVGALKPSALVPETMAAGAGSDPVCVVGFRALKDFHAALLADNLQRAGIDARSVELDLRPEGRVDANSQAFARAFDDPAFRGEVVGGLGDLRDGERVAFPAVLGVDGSAWRELQDRLGRPVFEVPTLPPSVPGMRVASALRERLRRAGGRLVLNNVVIGAERSGDSVSELRVRVGLREVTQRADWVVLASGGFASGGLELDSRWQPREVALGLPVSGVPADQRFVPQYFADQPMARAGVAVGPELRPEGLANVLVAGATLAGAAPWKEKSGDGISLATGHRAAELILGARVRMAEAS